MLILSDLLLKVVEFGSGVGVEHVYDISFAAPEDFGTSLISVIPGSQVSVTLSLVEISDGIVVSGAVGVLLRGECCRCLGNFDFSGSYDFEEFFAYEKNFFPEDQQKEALIVKNGCVDLNPIILDAVVGSLPFQPVCDDKCLGLCSTCGVLLSEGSDHKHDFIDSRWEALSGLSEKILLSRVEKS